MNGFGFAENKPTYDALIKAYSQKHRAYHTFDHIAACLKNSDKVRDQLDHPHEVELALWFHDAVYNPLSSRNEKDSAVWAQEFFELNEFEDDEVINRVFDLIMVTEHSGETKTSDEKFMIDIDLSILGTRSDVYDQFEKDVRFEYKFVPAFIFRKKRKAILSEFLARDRIYHHPYFRDALEAPARVNLAAAISNLSN